MAKMINVDELIGFCNTERAMLHARGNSVTCAALRRVVEFAKEYAVEAQPVNTDKCKALRNIEGIRLILSNVYNTGSTLQDCDYDAIYKRLDVIENILKGETNE